jgi:hypothetical protein
MQNTSCNGIAGYVAIMGPGAANITMDTVDGGTDFSSSTHQHAGTRVTHTHRPLGDQPIGLDILLIITNMEYWVRRITTSLINDQGPWAN